MEEQPNGGGVAVEEPPGGGVAVEEPRLTAPGQWSAAQVAKLRPLLRLHTVVHCGLLCTVDCSLLDTVHCTHTVQSAGGHWLAPSVCLAPVHVYTSTQTHKYTCTQVQEYMSKF